MENLNSIKANQNYQHNTANWEKKVFISKMEEIFSVMNIFSKDFFIIVKEGPGEDDYMSYEVKYKYYQQFMESNKRVLTFHDTVYDEKLQNHCSKRVSIKLENIAQIGYIVERFEGAFEIKYVNFNIT